MSPYIYIYECAYVWECALQADNDGYADNAADMHTEIYINIFFILMQIYDSQTL